MTVLRRTLALLVFSLSCLSSTAGADVSVERSERPPKSRVPELTGSPDGVSYPWKLDREHRFLWLHRREKIGETRFLVRMVPFPGRPRERLVEVKATRNYHREGVVQQATGTTHVSLAGEPQRFEERLTVLHATSAQRSTQHTTFERRGQTVKVTVVQNGREERPAVQERLLQEGTFLCWSQAVEHWVVFVSVLPEDFESHEVKLYYPDLRRVFTVQLRAKGEDVIKVGKTRTTARRYTFRSSKNMLNGSLWIGADRRLLQITFPDTQVRVVLATE